VTALATTIHLLTVAAFAGSVLVIVSWPDHVFAWVAGLLGAAVAIEVRPRIWKYVRKPKGEWLTRTEAPALFGLLDRCAGALDAPRAQFIRVTTAFNASTAKYGWKREARLLIGAPLWQVLSGPQRVALLGHELAHQVNGDVGHGIWAGTARESALRWMRVLNPRESAYERASRLRLSRSRQSAFDGIAALLAPLLMVVIYGPLFLIALGCHRALLRLELRSGQRAEYLADQLASRLASTGEAIGLLERLALGESVIHFLRQAKAVPPQDDLWHALRAYLDSVPDHEKSRRILLEELHNTRVDRTHPASYLRRRLLAARPAVTGSIKVEDAEWAAIEAELTPHCRRIAQQLGIKPPQQISS
jgi:Zn-dependent protease with chaperone function